MYFYKANFPLFYLSIDTSIELLMEILYKVYFVTEVVIKFTLIILIKNVKIFQFHSEIILKVLVCF